MNKSTTSWTNQVWQAASSINDKIIHQPFVQELLKGTLAQDKFLHYIQQDALYLNQYARALANILPKLTDKEQTSTFLSFIQDTMEVEKALHQQYLNKIENQSTKMSPECFTYTQFLLASTSMQDAHMGLAAVLPCFWVYKYVGDHILERYQQNNPYSEWIKTYSGEAYGQAVEKAIYFADVLAAEQTEATRAKMTETFLIGCKMEYLFWNSAYKMNQWTI